MIKKQDLTALFGDYVIEWGAMRTWFNPSTHRMQYLYLVCKSVEEAKRLLLNRHVIINKYQGPKFTIEAIPSSLTKAFELFSEPENVAVIITPPSSMEVVAELPRGEELLSQMRNVV